MEVGRRWLTEEEKTDFIAALASNLLVLRSKAEVSQEELANIVGISRQTYCALERNIRPMSWNTYLSILFFYDNNLKTHEMLRQLSIYPDELISFLNIK